MHPRTEALEEQKQSITKHVVAQMYENPFWQDRFGDRGRHHSENDGQFHVAYLITAIRTESTEVMTNYATWLRGVLVHRGMCTRHLAENFERIADELRRRSIPGAEDAARYLEAAVSSLAYVDQPERDVQRSERELSTDIKHSLYLDDAAGHASLVPGINGKDDLRYLISFLVDAVAFGDENIFVKHVQWQRDFLQRHDHTPNLALHVLDVLESKLEQFVDLGEERPLARILKRGRTALIGVTQ